MSQAVCRDFVNGFCRYGDRCRFYHPPKNGGGGARSFSNANSTPLGGNKQGLKYQFTEDTVRIELQSETPRWTLSSFGVSKHEPNLFSGSDLSPEELKWKSVQALASNSPQSYIQEEDTLTSQAEKTISTALQNLPTTVKLAEKLHDARYPPGTNVGDPRPSGFNEDAVLAGNSGPSKPGFGQASTSAFGQSSFGASGGPPTAPKAMSAFGSPAFGSSSFGQKPSGSAFGSQPAFGSSSSVFGKSSFGAPSAFGASSTPQSRFAAAPTTSAFGAAASPSDFGSAPSPSAFGAAPSSSAFGASSNPSAFAAPSSQSAFGAAPAPQSAFGASSTPAFGQSGFGAKPSGSAFGTTPPTSAFGATSTPAAFGSSALGAPSAFGASSPTVTALGSAPSPSAGFGQSAFGQSSKPSGFGAFSQAPPSASAFDSPADPPAFSGFGPASAPNPSTQNPFGQASSSFTSAFGQTSNTPASFAPDINVPDGWSYDDPWSYLLPTPEESAHGKLDEADLAAFRSMSFKFDSIPILPPPISLRG